MFNWPIGISRKAGEMSAGRFSLALFALFCICPAPWQAFAEVGDWKVSSSLNYETGEYGTGSTSETWYVPVTVKRYFPEGDVSVTVPYVQTSGTGVTTIDGNVVPIGTPGVPETNSGLGDLVLRGSYYLLSEGDEAPFDLNLTGKIKLPTADESRGLGTGEFDAGAGLEFARSLTGGFTGYFDVYYTAIGDPPGLELEDRVSFDLGLSTPLAPKWTVSAFYEESTPLVKTNSHLRDILVSFEFRADRRTRAFFGAVLGLNEASPDYGLSAGVSYLL